MINASIKHTTFQEQNAVFIILMLIKRHYIISNNYNFILQDFSFKVLKYKIKYLTTM